MPKEHVKSMFARPPHQAIEPGDETKEPFRVEVLWGTNDYVQVATVDVERDPFTLEHGYFVDLDRKGINDLIRLLRRARDKAYGRDE